MMLRDVPKTLYFFQSALQLPVISAAPHQAMLQAGSSTLVLVQAKDEASCTTGYSPFLTFAVRDFDDSVVRLLQAGANLDGPIKHPHTGKVLHRIAACSSNGPHCYARLPCFVRLADTCSDWWRSNEDALLRTRPQFAIILTNFPLYADSASQLAFLALQSLYP
jgi:hypothetical protein